jgi:hypothetical protein
LVEKTARAGFAWRGRGFGHGCVVAFGVSYVWRVRSQWAGEAVGRGEVAGAGTEEGGCAAVLWSALRLGLEEGVAGVAGHGHFLCGRF